MTDRCTHTVGLFPLLGLIVSLSVSFILSGNLLPLMQQESKGHGSQSIVGSILGRTRLGLSGHFYEMADLFLHRGVGHVQHTAFENSFFQSILREISPKRITHASGQQLQGNDTMALAGSPFGSTQPGEAYLVAAFLASGELGRFDVAHQILAEARWNNPKSYPIQMEEGRVYYKEKKYAEAAKAFDIALSFCNANPGPDQTAASDDKASILLYRAMIFEKLDNKEGAARDLREILKIHPERTFLSERIEELENGIRASDLATKKWNDIMKESEEMNATCHTDHGDEGDHGHDGKQDHKH